MLKYVAFFIFAVFLFAGGRPALAETILITDVRILTMAEEGTIENGYLLIEDEVITSVSAGKPDKIVADRVVNGKGHTLLPGLVDMHVHYFDSEDGILYLANGVTTVRNMTGSLQQASLDTAARAGTLAGPRVVQSGPLMDGPGSYVRGASLIVENPDQAIGAVRAQRGAGFEAVKLYEFLSEESYRTAVAEARKLKMKVYSHTPTKVGIAKVIEIGVDSLEHLDGYETVLLRDGYTVKNTRLPWAEQWSNSDPGKFSQWAIRTQEAGLVNVPTFVLLDGNISAKNPDRFENSPVAKYLADERLSEWRQSFSWRRSILPLAESERSSKLAFGRALRAAGAQMLIGTDAPNPYVVPGFAIHSEMANFKDIGYSNEEILQVATAGAGKFFGNKKHPGTVTAGAVADLVLVDGDPRKALGNLRNIAGVMINGHWRDRSELDLLLKQHRVKNADNKKKGAE